MYDGGSVFPEVERSEGHVLAKGQGFILLDLSILYPLFWNDKGLSLEFILSDKESPIDLEQAFTYGSSQHKTKLNHRYPNPRYTTLSKKIGNKVCKVGYPVVDNIEKLNRYKYLHILAGDWVFTLHLGFTLTARMPYIALTWRLSINPEYEFQFMNVLTTKSIKKQDYGFEWIRNYYCLQEQKNCPVKTVLLKPCVSQLAIGDENRTHIAFDKVIEMKPANKDEILLP